MYSYKSLNFELSQCINFSGTFLKSVYLYSDDNELQPIRKDINNWINKYNGERGQIFLKEF